MNQADKARAFLALHQQQQPLLLPNAWNAATARVFQEAGFPAVGTTSAGIAFSMGYPDGEVMPFSEMMYVVRRLVAAVDIPVSADMVAGFAHTSDQLAQHINEVIDAGAVGINFEDSRPDGSLLNADDNQLRLALIRHVARQREIPLVINARVDTYWLTGGKGDLDETLRRAKAYVRAGADCLFVPLLTAEADIARLRAEVNVPINLLATGLTLDRVRAARIERLSLGSGPFSGSLGQLKQAADTALLTGDLTGFGNSPVSYATLMRWFG